MYSTETPSASSPAAPSSDDWGFADPWEEGESGQRIDTDNWLLGYVDMLTLMLTLLVMLLAFNHIEVKHPEFAEKKDSRDIAQEIEPNQASASRAPEARAVRQSDGVLETRVGYQFLPANHGANLDDAYPEGLSILSAEKDLFTIPGLRNGTRNSLLAGMDLSIEPVALLDNEIGTPIGPLSTIPIEHLVKRTPEPKTAIESAGIQSVASLKRLVSARNLDGLVDVLETHNAVRMEMNERILFETGDAELKPHGEALLDELVRLFLNQPGNIHVEGHTDNVPIATARYPSNWELSANRASGVARYLIDHGIDPDRLRAVGFADTKPRASNRTPAGRAKNRRVSLIIEMDDPEVAQIP